MESGRINAISSSQNLKITNYGQPSFELRFDKGDIFEHKPVIPMFHQPSQLVSAILEKFEKTILAGNLSLKDTI